MSKKIAKEIRQGLLQSRMSERKVDRSIKKINRAQKKLLFEVKQLLDSNNDNEARLLVKELAQSQKTIKNMVRMKFYCRGVNYFFKNAQTQMIKGEAMEDIAEVLVKVNRIMSVEDLDQAFLALENESEELNLNLEQATESLETLDEPIDDDEYVDNIIKELQGTEQEKVVPKINEIVDLNKLIPSVPKFDQELREDEDDLEGADYN